VNQRREKETTFGAKDEAKGEPKKTKEIAKPKADQELKKEVEEQRKKIAELESKLSKPPETSTPATPKPPDARFPNKSKASITCYRCENQGHMAKECRTKNPRNPNYTPRFPAPNGTQQGFDPQIFAPQGFAPQGFVPQTQFVPGFVSKGQFPNASFLADKSRMDNKISTQQQTSAEQTNNVRPIHESGRKTCIELDYEGEKLSALLDTGSDVSIAGDEVARKYGWEIHEHPTKTVKIANDEEMIIAGAAKIPFRAGRRSVDSEILITPDLNGFIIGIDWLEKQGRFQWNFRDK